MRKFTIGAGAALILLAVAGGGWLVFGRAEDPVQLARNALLKGDLRTATIALRSAVRDHPDNPVAHVLLGESQLAAGDAVAAEKEARTARDLHADPVATALLLGRAYVAQNRWQDLLGDIPGEAPQPDQEAALLVLRATAQAALNDRDAARASLAKAERDAPANADIRVAGARIAASWEDLDAALRKLDEALAIDPKQADALRLKGQVVDAKGDHTAGLALLDQAVAAAPNQPGIRLDRGNVLLRMGQDARARADADAVLAADPRNPGARYLSMILQVRAGKFADADQSLLALDPVIGRFPRGLFFSALIKANLGQTAQAEDLARRYVARAPSDAEGTRLLARILIAGRKPGQAVEALNRATAAGRPDAETLDLLGRAYAAMGRPDQAARSFEQASGLAPNNAEIMTRLATSRLQIGDTAGATAALEKTQQIDPSQQGVSQALVAAALTSGELDRAQSLLDQLRQQSGDTEQTGLLDGLIRLGRLDMDGARTAFETNLQRYPDSSLSRINLAKVLLLQNHPADALRRLQEVLAKEPANGQALTIAVQILLQEKRGPEAMELANAARAAAPGNLALLAGQAGLAARLGDPARGVSLIEAARPASGPLPSELLPLLARLQEAAGRPDAAKATYTQMLDANPANFEIRRGLVNLLVATGDVPAAQASLRDGLRTAPGDAGLLGLLVQLELRARGMDAAQALAASLRADRSQMPAAATLKGDLLAGARRFAEAEAAYDAEFRGDPTPLLALRLSAAQAAAGQPDKAYATLKAFQAKNPTNIDVAQALGSMDVVARRYKDAEANLRLVLSVRPSDPAALNNLAWSYNALGDSRARPLAQRAFMEAPTPELGDTLGWILVTQGEAAKALPLLQQSSAQRPDDRTMRFHVAAALKAVGRRQDAVALLRPLVDDPAEFDDKPAARAMLAELSAG